MDYPKHIVALGGLITDSEDRVLLMRHPRRGWEFPGGQVEQGEDLLTALQREVEEETGIIASIGQMVGVYSNIKEPVKVMFGFLGQRISGEPRTSEESLEVGWFSRSEARLLVTYPPIRDRLKDMLDFDGRVVYRVYTTNPYQVHKEVII